MMHFEAAALKIKSPSPAHTNTRCTRIGMQKGGTSEEPVVVRVRALPCAICVLRAPCVMLRIVCGVSLRTGNSVGNAYMHLHLVGGWQRQTGLSNESESDRKKENCLCSSKKT